MTFRKRYACRGPVGSGYRGGRERPRGGLLLVTLMQAVLCTVMIAAAFILSGVMGMTEIKTAYSELASDDTDAVAVFSAAREAAGSEKASQLLEVLKLIIRQVFPEQPAPAGGMLQYDAKRMEAPAGVTTVTPLTAAPMKSPLEGRLTSPFGPRENPVTGRPDWHTGVDLAAPEGTPVGAAWPGVVCDLGSDDIYGNHVTIDHGNFKTRYCHCQSIAAPVGTRLRQGETVAFSGNTGMSTGPHLHLELIIDGSCADPLAEQPRWIGF